MKFFALITAHVLLAFYPKSEKNLKPLVHIGQAKVRNIKNTMVNAIIIIVPNTKLK